MVKTKIDIPVPAAASPSDAWPRRFRPILTLGCHQDLHALAADLIGRSQAEQLTRIGEAVEVVEARRAALEAIGVPASELGPTLAYATALRLLRDLVQQGWTLGIDDEGIHLGPPVTVVAASDDLAAAKELLKQSFAFARRAQLAEPATRSFIETMERRGISTLFADGRELADRLDAAIYLDGTIADAIKPSLELVTPDSRDETTGLRLQDVWRYARHFWSIPYQSTPGRNLFYLVRDDAGPHRPVIGIAALGNAVLGLAQRDDALGWTARGLRARLERSSTEQRGRLARHLLDVLRSDIDAIYAADLPVGDGPWDLATVSRLREVERDAAFDRRKALAEAGDERSPDYHLIRDAHDEALDGDPETVDWLKIAKTALYRRKRAGTLADLIQAWLALAARGVDVNPDSLGDALDDDRGRAAVESTLRRIKQRAIAENLMEIITCGAVPPYGDVLGGKLVAMLLTSPRVVADIRERYAGRVSLIASGLKGAPVRRDPNLAVLTTSSLYSVGSSQYNRIRVPVEILDGRNGHVAFERIGKTDSFGTVHFAPDTAEALVALARLSDENRRLVNHLFGEGMSPKLRAMRSGLEALGLDPDVFLRHHSPRLLYAVRLARNTDEVLLGLDGTLDYLLRGSPHSDGTTEIAHYWRERWLEPRVQRSDVLSRLRDASRDSYLLGAQLDDSDPASVPRATREGEPVLDEAKALVSVSERPHASEFIERIYRSTNSYADRLSPEELAWIDVDLGLGGHLLASARAGKQIIVTGNPGDGKTHLIERLRPELEQIGALVLTDANVHTDDEIIRDWRTCDREGRPMVLAINEWPLFVLRRHPDAAHFEPLHETLRQVQQAVYYLAPPSAPHRDTVAVVDLSLRNVLAAPIVLAVVDRLTDERFYQGLPDGDPALANRRALLEPRVRERLAALLDQVARRGQHATMRQLVGFIAYMITGGRAPVERLTGQGSQRFHYAQLAFAGGVGSLFDAVRGAFDPATVTHPWHDADLWRGATDPAGWLDPRSRPVGVQQLPPSDADRQEFYAALKRRFYFEHVAGADLIGLVPNDERMFDVLIGQGHDEGSTVVRDLVLAINRFFEPDCPDSEREELSLWQSHRFDVRSPHTFIALHHLSHRRLRVHPSKLAPWVEAWLPPEQRRPNSFALVGHSNTGAAATLVVDRALYLTLYEAQRGLGRSSWSRSATRRVTRFIDRLHQLVDMTADVEDVRIRNTEIDLDHKFEIQRNPPRYML